MTFSPAYSIASLILGSKKNNTLISYEFFCEAHIVTLNFRGTHTYDERRNDFD